jgi:hypothetical protein
MALDCFHTLVVLSLARYTASSDRLTGSLEGIWKETVVVSLKYYLTFTWRITKNTVRIRTGTLQNVFLHTTGCDFRRGFELDIRFTDHLYTRIVSTSNYSATANLHSSQITTATAESFPAHMSSSAVPWQRFLTVEILQSGTGSTQPREQFEELLGRNSSDCRSRKLKLRSEGLVALTTWHSLSAKVGTSFADRRRSLDRIHWRLDSISVFT